MSREKSCINFSPKKFLLPLPKPLVDWEQSGSGINMKIFQKKVSQENLREYVAPIVVAYEFAHTSVFLTSKLDLFLLFAGAKTRAL
jgi:hypothetical protein